jgi:5-hydroxyisourate hydrolase
MSGITTHVLDVAVGRPASGVAVRLDRQDPAGWVELARGETDTDGRLRSLLPDGSVAAGAYRLTFAVGDYFGRCRVASFYSEIVVAFVVDDPHQHYHVPLLLSPFGYSTYRGS